MRQNFRQNSKNRRTAGFTLFEMLVVLLVIGILAAIGGAMLSGRIREARSMDFVEALAQDINLARSVALARGEQVQIEFVSASGYVVRNLGAPGQPVLASRTDPAVNLSAVSVGDHLICNSKGFCEGQNAAGVPKVIARVNCTSGGRTRILSITVLGLTRVES